MAKGININITHMCCVVIREGTMLKRILRSLALYRVRTVVSAMAVLLVTMGVYPNAGWALTAAEVQKLVASDADTGDVFGGSVSVSGDTALIGARGVVLQGRGAAYVYRNWRGFPRCGHRRRLHLPHRQAQAGLVIGS